jgi:uncharacterized pyridoxamine 5'-phosphate oxidase family protein
MYNDDELCGDEAASRMFQTEFEKRSALYRMSQEGRSIFREVTRPF